MIELPREQRRHRYVSEAEAMTKQSRRSQKSWSEFRRAVLSFYGRSYGEDVYEWIRRGEHDFAFACEKLLGVKPFPWQLSIRTAMEEHRYDVVEIGNSGGKTTGYSLIDMLAPFYRWFVTPEWGTREYRVLHLAPEEAQSLEVKRKIDAILHDNSSEQMYRIPGGWDHRPCLLTPFFEEGKPDGIHQGYFIAGLGGEGSITFRPSTYKAKGVDGTDPAVVTWDELRHEKNFYLVLNTILMPRFLRVPFARMLMFYTALGASVDLLNAAERGLSGLPEDVDWHTLRMSDLVAANPTLAAETIERGKRNIDKRFHDMVFGGKAIQPEGAKFSQASVVAAMIGTTEPPWLSDMVTVRRRMVERCETCAKIARGEQVLHFNNAVEHPAVGYLDPASSAAGADAIVAAVWDLQPPTFPRRWAECVYIEELPAGTKIQRVALHAALLSMIIHGVVGFDQNSALGHNMTDNLADFPTRDEALGIGESAEAKMALKYLEPELRKRLLDIRDELAAEPDLAPIEHNSRKEKDVDIDYLSGLLDLEKVGIHFHRMTKLELVNYIRNDKNVRQDFVMVQAGCAWLAKSELPDMYAERAKRDKGGRRTVRESGSDDAYLGTGGDDPYFSLPGDIGDVLGSLDGLAGRER